MIIHQGELFASDSRFYDQVIETFQRAQAQPMQYSMSADERRSLITQLPIQGGVAVVTIRGQIWRGESWYSPTWDTIVQDLKFLEARQNVTGVVLLMDSGGGVAMGCEEACDAVEQFKKPVVAYVAGHCLSACYRLACHCDKVFVTKSAQVGSIGTALVMADYSKQVEAEGVRIVAEATGPMKAFGHWGLPITDDQRAFMQERVAVEQAGFLRSLTARGLNAEQQAKVTDGRFWSADQALQLGLIDGVKEVSEVISSAVQLVQTLKPVTGGKTSEVDADVEQSVPVGSTEGSASVSGSTSQPAAQTGEVVQGISTVEIKQLCPGAPAEFVLEQFEAMQSVATTDARVKVLQAFSARQSAELEEARKQNQVSQAVGTASVGSTQLTNAPASGDAGTAVPDVIQQFEGLVEEAVKSGLSRRDAVGSVVQENKALHGQYLAATRNLSAEQIAARRRRNSGGRLSAEFVASN